jgi:hypothetical protein
MRKLEPWAWSVPLKMDWLAGRGLQPLERGVVQRPRHRGLHVSDHEPIVVEFVPGDPAKAAGADDPGGQPAG